MTFLIITVDPNTTPYPVFPGYSTANLPLSTVNLLESSGSTSGSVSSQLFSKGYYQQPGLVDSVRGVSYSQHSAAERNIAVPQFTTTAATLPDASSTQYQSTSVYHDSQSTTSHDGSSGFVDSSITSSQYFTLRELQKSVQALELELESSKKSQNQTQELPHYHPPPGICTYFIIFPLVSFFAQFLSVICRRLHKSHLPTPICCYPLYQEGRYFNNQLVL